MHISWYKTINIVTRLEIRACRETPRLSNRLVSKLCFPNMKYFEVIVTVKRLFLRYYLDKSKLEKNGKIERIKGYLKMPCTCYHGDRNTDRVWSRSTAMIVWELSKLTLSTFPVKRNQSTRRNPTTIYYDLRGKTAKGACSTNDFTPSNHGL